MSSSSAARIRIEVAEDTTFVVPCREGDRVIWFRYKGLFADPKDAFTLAGFWETEDGDRIAWVGRPRASYQGGAVSCWY